MKIVNLLAQNFRGLKAVSLASKTNVNVIVGVNAVGKSTLLEAIRLPKVLLASRIDNEGQAALIQLGALSQHNQAIGSPGVDIGSLANNPQIPITLRIIIRLTDSEASFVRGSSGDIALMMVQAERFTGGGGSPLAMMQFLSTETGRTALANKINEVQAQVARIQENSDVNLELILDPLTRTVRGNDAFSGALISILDRRLPNHKTLFSLFPADRAFPQGEQNIQMGAGEASAQLNSHMAQPLSKYSRLKQTIIQNLLFNPQGSKIIVDEFNLIFENLLPGKRFRGMSVNALGLLKVLIDDIDLNKTYDIDQMSSGEKGLVLTFLLLRLSMETGGIVLLDEPELHLNPAVQAKILPFLIEHCVKPMSLQLFICTHSSEIVRQTYERDDCSLFHLRSGDDLTPILKQDHQELFEVFERLGDSPADVLFTKGNVFVEGEHDAQTLMAGFPDLLAGFKVAPLGGRAEVEREVPNLKREEKSGSLRKRSLFIMDLDRQPTSLTSSSMVRVKQLNRYCLENYLLDPDIIFDLINTHGTIKPASRGKFPEELKQIAMSQIEAIALRKAYDSHAPEPAVLLNEDMRDDHPSIVMTNCASRLKKMSETLKDFDSEGWKAQLNATYTQRKAELEEVWETSWKEHCSGKKVIDDLYRKYGINLKKQEFKRQIIRRMAEAKSDDWLSINGFLRDELAGT